MITSFFLFKKIGKRLRTRDISVGHDEKQVFFYLKKQAKGYGHGTFREVMTTGFARGCQGRGVVVRVHAPSALIRERLFDVRKRLFVVRRSGNGLGAQGFSTERARLAGGIHFTRLRCTRLQHRTCKTSRGHFASLVVSKKGTRLQHRTCKTSLGHFASLVISKKGLLPMGISIFFFQKYPRF